MLEQDRNDSVQILQDESISRSMAENRSDNTSAVVPSSSNPDQANNCSSIETFDDISDDGQRDDHNDHPIEMSDSAELRRDSEQIKDDTEDDPSDYQVLPELYRPNDDDEMSDLPEEFDGYDSDTASSSRRQQQLDECLAVADPHYRHLGALEKEHRSKSPQPDSNVAEVVDQQSKGIPSVLQCNVCKVCLKSCLDYCFHSVTKLIILLLFPSSLIVKYFA